MEPTRHLALLRAEGDRLAAMPAEALTAPVPALPEWTVERVVRHVGRVHRWVTTVVTTGDGATAPESLPKGPACLPAYRDALDTMLAALDAADPDALVPSLDGTDTVAFWLRRQAHEVAVHRMDAADAVHAAGGPAPDPLTVDGAADAIDEWADLFLGRLWPARRGPFPADVLGATIHVHGTDDPSPADGAEWLLTVEPERVRIDRTHAKGDVALRGPAADLLLVLWRRRPLDTVDVIGDRAVAERLLDLARF